MTTPIEAAADSARAVPDAETRLRMYRLQVEIRAFEKRAYDLFMQNLVKGTSHLSLGQEAIAAGFASRCARTTGRSPPTAGTRTRSRAGRRWRR
jgi:TPP-dependent pyruvate/acetoin dehydrogenase alpha subunit